jgi:glyoxylase-like metal-dependent hydrolase (beta-lactamase superfamily II)
VLVTVIDVPICAPGLKSWWIGSVRVTRILEMDPVTVSASWLLKTTAAEVCRIGWLRPHFATEAGELRAHIQAFVLESAGRRIVVDPCVGNSKPRSSAMFSMRQGEFLEHLAAAGFPAGSIDYVLCTHLHFDHCGWNTRLLDDRWVPTFPNARYLFSRREYERARIDKAEDQDITYLDSIRPVVEAGLADLVEADHSITSEVRLLPAPGHTSGHCCVAISSGGEQGLITGDMMHHPFQAALPDVCSHFCWDDSAANATRREILNRCEREGTVVFGSHFAGPTAVRVYGDGAAWRMSGI